MANGWIKLYDSLLEWEWYRDLPTKVLFVHCLLKANVKPGTRFKGKELSVGEFITTQSKLAEETGLTRQQVKTALKKLESTSEISIKSTNKQTAITVENWGLYQGKGSKNNQQITNKQPTNNQQATSIQSKNKEYNNNNNNNIYITHGQYNNVKLTAEDLESLMKEFPLDYQDRIERLSEYIASSGKKYKNHLATIRAWARKEKPKKQEKPKTKYNVGVDI